MPVFVDTKVLVYAADPGTGNKHLRARRWLEHLAARRAGRVSYQVLQEYYVTVTRKPSDPMDPADARQDGLDLGGLVVLDPFTRDPSSTA